ncbi:major facilitator superfamily domain-containing protein [Dissophora ornata]|nr:major facilitator superfamily domain-containing protein [Dissophora ornata]
MSTLGPGIPVTPTASVFGKDLNGFISKAPANPGGLFGYSPEEEKKLVRKIDWRIIPILGMFYGVSTLNRANLLNARLFAFESALHVTPEQFTWVTALFYIGYGLAEIPCNLALLYLTPKVWLPASMFIWGCITFMLAWTKGFYLLLICRFFLGVAEAALIPGVLIYISMFYKRSEQTFRLAILQAFSSGAGALGGFISRVTGHLDGRLGLLGWQWVFIVDSIATIVLAIAAWFLLTKSPESAEWLNQRETSIAIYRIRNDTKVKMTRRISRHNIGAALKDGKVYLFMAMNLCISISSYLKGGFEALVSQEPTNDARLLAQLLSTPTYILGAISTFFVAILADRTQQRGMILMALGVVMVAAYCMVLLTLNVYGKPLRQSVNYAGVLLLSIGQTPLTPIVTSWLTTNIGGYAKREIAVAMFLLSSSMGGVIGPQLYKSRDAPRYIKGHLISISCMVLVIFLAALQRFMLRRENNRRDYSVSFGVNPLKYFSKAELRDLNDKHPAFRYTL